jgi:hypothetical protein
VGKEAAKIGITGLFTFCAAILGKIWVIKGAVTNG